MNRIYLFSFFLLMLANARLMAANIKSCRSGTSLHAACANGNLEIVKLLVSNKADPNIKDENGNTPILVACLGAHVDVINYLLDEEKININAANKAGDTLLHLTCKFLKGVDAEKIVGKISEHQHIFLNAYNREFKIPLHIACENSNVLALRSLLKHPDIDVNFPAPRQFSPLHIACKTKDGEGIVKELLKHPDIDVNAKCREYLWWKVANAMTAQRFQEDDLSPLHLACAEEREGIIRLLLKTAKVNINEISPACSHTPLGIAMRYSYSNIVRLLLQEDNLNIYIKSIKTGGDSLIKRFNDNWGTKIDIDEDVWLIIESFIEYIWGKITAEDKEIIFEFCKKHSKADLIALILKKQDENKNPLELFAGFLEGNEDISNDFYIDVNKLFVWSCYVDEYKVCAMLAKNYNFEASTYSRALFKALSNESSIKLIRLLIDNKADANYKNPKDNQSVLHLACRMLYGDVIKILIEENGADVNAERKSNDQKIIFPLDEALCSMSELRNPEEEHRNLIRYLLMRNASFSEEYKDSEYLIEEREDILKNTKVSDN